MKFINLLKKELSELINVQMIASLVMIVAMFALIGSVASDAIDDIKESTKTAKINIIDRDETEFTDELISMLKDTKGVTLKEFNTEGDDYAELLKANKVDNLIILPEGFTETFESGKTPRLISITRMKSASTMSNVTSGNDSAIYMINDVIYDIITKNAGLTEEQVELMSSPVEVTENTVVDDKSAEIASGSIISKLSFQSSFLPIVIFMLIMMTTQSLMNAISSEKIDKTLETLLSAPISRGSIIGSKMLAATIIAIINAGVYMFAFSKFISTAADPDIVEKAVGTLSVDDALVKLGLNLSAADYVLIGLQLFFTIMICLSVSIILGALANDAKSAQNLLLPIMFLAMVPYFVSILMDINELPTVVKYVLYAIPFTHTFSAISNLSFGNMGLFFGGLIYQVIVFAICMFFALRLFKSDKILTISLNLGQKSKFKKKKGQPEDE